MDECVVYTPHGVAVSAIEKMTTVSPRLKPLCLIHGLHDVKLSVVQQLNLGGHHGLKVYRALKSKSCYWVGTHDEQKIGGGIVAWFLRRNTITLNQALQQEKVTKIRGDGNLDDIIFEEIGNGGKKKLL
jgi:hypothetical protein